MAIRVGQRRRMKSTAFGLPRKKKFPLNTKKRAISAVAYSKKLARERKITAKERDIILGKVHKKYPDIKITPLRKRKVLVHHSKPVYANIYSTGMPFR